MVFTIYIIHNVFLILQINTVFGMSWHLQTAEIINLSLLSSLILEHRKLTLSITIVSVYSNISLFIYRWLDARTPYLGARLKNDRSRRPVEERPIPASGSRTTYLSTRSKNELSRRPVEERPISAPDSRTTYLKRDFCFSDFVVAALRDFKIRLLQASDVRLKF